MAGRKTSRLISRFPTSVRTGSAIYHKGNCGHQSRNYRNHNAGMSFWLPREFTVGMDFQHPVESVRRAIANASNEGANAIVLTGHMGLKPRTGGDDFANT